MKPNPKPKIETFVREDKCPVTLHGKVIGWNIMRSTYEDKVRVGSRFIQYIPKEEK